ncbi:hypothetical protein XENOCAPTIV_007158 [Xenoophorus captivus]|uniref:Vacuolar protein sorting-associated protein 16 homolog n=1 Tax=Xenoophorus captivus TaxID=1517983 RepID=A0ABV0RG13_9TELE
MEDQSVLVGELDGVRIIGSISQELLQEVPLVCQDIFKIASMAPGALLLEAHREYEKSSQKADEYLREIKEQNVLGDAVQQCVEAAAHEHDPETQKALMRAASFGKCFLTEFSPDQFVTTCRELRVLNAVRESSVGMPLTHTHLFPTLVSPVLLSLRLVYRQFYPLAIEICRYLKIPDYQGVSRVLKHWASCKVQQKDLTDEAIARAVCAKVGDSPGVSYSDIAARAYECGRTELAIKEPQTLKDLYNQDDDHQELGNFYVSASYREKRLEGRLAQLQSAVDEYNKAKNDFSAKVKVSPVHQIYPHPFSAEDALKPSSCCKLCTGGILLLWHPFTCRAVCLSGRHQVFSAASRLLSKVGTLYLWVSPVSYLSHLVRYWWLKLKSLAEKEQWEELEKFSKSKKSPIGFYSDCSEQMIGCPQDAPDAGCIAAGLTRSSWSNTEPSSESNRYDEVDEELGQ